MLRCAECSEPLPPKRGRGKPRKFCEKCRPSRTAGRKKPQPQAAEVIVAPVGVSLLASVESELQQAGTLHSSIGQQAVALAQRIMAYQDSGSALASMHKELPLVMAAATADAKADTGDLLDELAARRGRRGA